MSSSSAARCGFRRSPLSRSWACSWPASSLSVVGQAFFPQTDAGQFTINMKAPTGTRIQVTNGIARIEDMIRKVVDPKDLKLILLQYRRSERCTALYTTNQGQYTATIRSGAQPGTRPVAGIYGPRPRAAPTLSSRMCARSSERVVAGRDSQSGRASPHRRPG